MNKRMRWCACMASGSQARGQVVNSIPRWNWIVESRGKSKWHSMRRPYDFFYIGSVNHIQVFAESSEKRARCVLVRNPLRVQLVGVIARTRHVQLAARVGAVYHVQVASESVHCSCCRGEREDNGDCRGSVQQMRPEDSAAMLGVPPYGEGTCKVRAAIKKRGTVFHSARSALAWGYERSIGPL